MMPEIVGNQLRIRVENPDKFKAFRTKDIGQKGKLQIILGYTGKVWMTQSYRFNLHDYHSMSALMHDLNSVKVTPSQYKRAVRLGKIYFG
jgi:hypothetical protein